MNAPLPPPVRAIKLVEQATTFGRDQVLIALGEKRLMVSKRQAEKLVGNNYLKTWEDNRLIHGYKKGTGINAKIEYNRLDLQKLQLSETYHYFMND